MTGLTPLWGDKLDSSLAGVAQLVEQLICNQQATGSIPVASTKGLGSI